MLIQWHRPELVPLAWGLGQLKCVQASVTPHTIASQQAGGKSGALLSYLA